MDDKTPQQRANVAQDKKRKGQPTFFVRLNDEEANQVEQAVEKFGSKKAMLLAGVKALLDHYNITSKND